MVTVHWSARPALLAVLWGEGKDVGRIRYVLSLLSCVHRQINRHHVADTVPGPVNVLESLDVTLVSVNWRGSR